MKLTVTFRIFFNVPKTDCAGWGMWHEWGEEKCMLRLVREAAGQRLLPTTSRSFRPSSRWLDNIIIYLQETEWKTWTGFIGLWTEPSSDENCTVQTVMNLLA